MTLVDDGEILDVFFSYRRRDPGALPLARALRAGGLSVWLDEQRVERFASITQAITRGLARSKAMVAFFSCRYLSRTACQWELATALSATRLEPGPERRILVVNPQRSPDHIVPARLRDLLYESLPPDADQAALDRLVAVIRDHVASLAGVFGDVAPANSVRWLPARRRCSTRFVGRVAELFAVDNALSAVHHPGTAGAAATGVAQIRGLGGIGKTMLAEEYARRFASGYPGGIFWLNAGVDHLAQLRAIAEGLGIRTERPASDGRGTVPLSQAEIEGLIAAAVTRRGQRCLWVVDDLPPDLPPEAVRRWLGAQPNGEVLVTTRATGYGWMAPAIDLDVLPAADAYALLTARRAPRGPAEREAAQDIARDLGRHALALDVAGGMLHAAAGLQSFAEFRADLGRRDEDVLELSGHLADDLPYEAGASIAAALLRSIACLGEEGRDLLRLAACLASVAIPPCLVAAALRIADGLDRPAARRRAEDGLRQVERLSLATPVERPAGGRVVHVLVSRTVHFHDERPDRRQRLRAAAVRALAVELRRSADPAATRLSPHTLAHVRHLALAASTPEDAALLDALDRYQVMAGSFGAAEQAFRREHGALRKTPPADHGPKRTRDPSRRAFPARIGYRGVLA
jgi:hypothetical protein